MLSARQYCLNILVNGSLRCYKEKNNNKLQKKTKQKTPFSTDISDPSLIAGMLFGDDGDKAAINTQSHVNSQGTLREENRKSSSDPIRSETKLAMAITRDLFLPELSHVMTA